MCATSVNRAMAAQRLDRLPVLILSCVSYFEILQGMRNKAELQALKKMLVQRQALVLPLTPAITERAGALLETLTLSHGLGMGDA
jgi:predicted nucleic acid-binding protein